MDNSANFKGEYKLVGMEEDGITYSEDDLAFMEELGLDFGLTLADEGKATLNLAVRAWMALGKQRAIKNAPSP